MCKFLLILHLSVNLFFIFNIQFFSFIFNNLFLSLEKFIEIFLKNYSAVLMKCIKSVGKKFFSDILLNETYVTLYAVFVFVSVFFKSILSLIKTYSLSKSYVK